MTPVSNAKPSVHSILEGRKIPIRNIPCSRHFPVSDDFSTSMVSCWLQRALTVAGYSSLEEEMFEEHLLEQMP
jgi:hypothetical protein